LHSEGIFWKAYQRSAYQLLMNCHVDYNVKRRYVKSAVAEVYSLGFPQAALQKLFSESEIRKTDAKHVEIDVEEIGENDYEEWRKSIPFSESQAKPMTNNQNDSDVLRLKLKSFDLSKATPIDCMMLVSELQKMLN
jgi:hypothetical protein